MSGFEVQSLAVKYGANSIIDQVSFKLGPGSVLAILGRSGCGKSTLLRALCGLHRVSAGTVAVDGKTVIDGDETLVRGHELRSFISLVPQTVALLPQYSILDNIAVSLHSLKRFSWKAARELASPTIESLGLGEIKLRHPHEISGGQAQRVQIARALVLQPPVLLLDEVTSSLDPVTSKELAELLISCRQSWLRGRGIIICVTHQIHFALQFADIVTHLYNGRLIDTNAATDFKSGISNPATLNLMQALAVSA